MNNTGALELLQDIFNCHLTSTISKKYLEFISKYKEKDNYVTRNKYLWENCFAKNKNNLDCYNPIYQTEKCVNAQVRFIKTVRLRPTLIELEKLLQDNLNLKIVLSMRDPRGIMNSRLPNWCGDNPHCNNVTQLCLQMEQDLASATLLNKFYKKRIALVSPRLDEERTSGKFIIFRLPQTNGHWWFSFGRFDHNGA